MKHRQRVTVRGEPVRAPAVWPTALVSFAVAALLGVGLFAAGGRVVPEDPAVVPVASEPPMTCMWTGEHR